MLHDLANDDGCVALKRFIIKDIHKNTVKIDPLPLSTFVCIGPHTPLHAYVLYGWAAEDREDGERDGERDVNNLLLFGAVSLSVCFAKLTLSLEYTQ